MSGRVVGVTLDNLDQLPKRCRRCLFWELAPHLREEAEQYGQTDFEKEAWVSSVLLEWGSCGRIVYVDSVPAGYAFYAPPSAVPRSVAFPTAPISADAVMLTAVRILPEFAGSGLGRLLVQEVAKDLTRRGVKAIEAFADEEPEAGRRAVWCPPTSCARSASRPCARTRSGPGCAWSCAPRCPGRRTWKRRWSSC